MPKSQTRYLQPERPSFVKSRLRQLLRVIQTPSAFRWLNRELYLFFLSLVAGVLGGGIAVLFRQSLAWLQYVVYGQNGDLSLIFARELPVPTWRIWAIPLLFCFLLAPLVWRWVPEARGEGVPEILEAVRLRQGKIKWQVIPAKLVASVISLATVASVGREGPIISSASALGSSVGQGLRIPRRYWNVMIACSGAAGIAATFNTPIAGAFFMAEVIMGSFSMEHFPFIVLSSVLGTVIGQHFFGTQAAFHVPEHLALHHPGELLGFIALGILAGLTAVAFIRGISWTRALYTRLPIPDLLKTPLGGVILIASGLYLSPNLVGNGHVALEHLIGSHVAPASIMHPGIAFLLFLMVAKIIAVGISLGSGFSGGVFAPSLFVGAPLGYIVGLLMQRISDAFGAMVSPETYAVIGMAAVFTGVSKAPISAIIMIFELTQDYQLMLPLMAACVMSFVVSQNLHKPSIYTEKLQNRGIDLAALNQEHLIMHHYRVKDLMKTNKVPVIFAQTTLEEAGRIMLKYKRHCLFLQADDRTLSGMLTLAHLKHDLLTEHTPLQDTVMQWVEPCPAVVYPNMSLTDVMQIFWHAHMEELPVIDPETGYLLGIIWERDIIGLYNAEVLKQHDALRIFSVQAAESRRQAHLELPKGFMLKKMTVFKTWHYFKIRDLQLRQLKQINILTVERMGDNGLIETLVPHAQLVLQPEDEVVLIGPIEALKSL